MSSSEPTTSNSNINPPLPQMPRPAMGPSDSELIPLRSSKINILKSGILIPAVVTSITCVLLFGLSNFYLIMNVAAGYLLFCIFYAAYVYSGIKKNILVYIFPCIVLYLELTTPIINGFIFFFRSILPGDTPSNAGFFTSFVTMFFGAGMMEELMKAIPALIGLVIALHFTQQSTPTASLSTSYADWFKVSTPLEGMLMGLAAGAAFTYVETLHQYVPSLVVAVAKKDGAGAGFANGFALLLPRVLQSVVGHMGWAAISGYFIGLAARYPGSMVKLLAIGWIVPSVLHGFWNSAANIGAIGIWISAGLSLILFVGCFLKAKQMEAARMGSAFIPTDSIIVGGEPLAVATGTTPETMATAWGGFSNILNAFGKRAAPKLMASSSATPTPSGDQRPRFTLALGTARFGILPGQTIDLSTLFIDGNFSPGTLAEVTVHPQDSTIVGLKNLSSLTWIATTDDGATTNVPPQRNVKLVNREKLTIGSSVIVVASV